MRALLAAGVVVGIGAASTLAAWTDNETATASLTAGTFGIVGSTDGATFTDHPAEGPAQLAFDAPAAGLIPETTVHASFSVRTTTGSAAGTASLAADAANGSALGAYLTYGVSSTAGACDAAAFDAGTVLVPRGSVLTTAPTATQNLDANGGSTITYCFEITMPANTDNAAQGLTVAPRWTVNAQNT
ncbi:hypothetical protein GCM10010922_26540 [Microbacterium sorbitolivorans]|uniref:SipW-dependent-type signal peptide-containing protein n=1 Tax=Microbacterium sorbitolivorans TaxID=1867410 RepID=UPI0013B06079|nr:SipW-dependent-type signal peptide-containing protein [Microbacterium sorbitolivorans]GGF49310.1 hypothetical protein GCM10010922_26540 [Microbacterium sorbitolivorans]